MFAEPNDYYRLQPQVEYSGGGPGSRIRTAIGAADDRPYIDPSTLRDPPWWFVLVKPFLRLNYQESFKVLPTSAALLLLEKAHVPPLCRLALGLHWGFINPQRDDFSLGDLAILLREAEILNGSLDSELERIEARSQFQIWRRLNSADISRQVEEIHKS